MIKLESSKMQKAIAKAKQMKPRVRMIGERIYSVTGSRGNSYTVTFSVANGLRLGACTCPAGEAGQMCYHIAAAAAVNIAIQSMRKAAAQVAAPAPVVAQSAPVTCPLHKTEVAADERAALIADVKAAWHRARPFENIGYRLHIQFGVTKLEDVSTDDLRKVLAALTPPARRATAPIAPRPRSSFLVVYRATADACARGEHLQSDSAGVLRVRPVSSLAAKP